MEMGRDRRSKHRRVFRLSSRPRESLIKNKEKLYFRRLSFRRITVRSFQNAGRPLVLYLVLK